MSDKERFIKELSKKDLNEIEVKYNNIIYGISSFYLLTYKIGDKEFDYEFDTLDELLSAKVLENGLSFNDIIDKLEIVGVV